MSDDTKKFYLEHILVLAEHLSVKSRIVHELDGIVYELHV
jgi:hypothetical protein